MGYFDQAENVKDYIKMVEGFDGRDLIEVLQRHVPRGSSVLELGMGPGKDLDMLRNLYQATGSDSSQIFLDLYAEKNPNADLLLLDAVTIATDRKFDCIYSNKVLHHLTREELQASLQRQATVLKPDGLLFHSFWYGDKEEVMQGLRFVYYTEATINKAIDDCWKILDISRYREMETDDSFYLILRKIK